jgi:nitroreductase
MDVHEALYTTRAMRRLRPDPIPVDVQARILDAAIRAPSGNNTQEDIRFVLVDDPKVKAHLGPLYREGQRRMAGIFADRVKAETKASVDAATRRMVGSIRHLAEHFEEVPLLLFGFMRRADVGDDSRAAAWRLVPREFADQNDAAEIYPAVWSAMLAARAEGIGATLTTALGAFHAADVLAVLGVPEGEGWVMYCCVTFGYPTGRWGVAGRRPVHEVCYRNRWAEPAGFEVPEPRWPPG